MKKLIFLLLGVLMAVTTSARDFSYTYLGKTVIYTVTDEDKGTCKVKGPELFYLGSIQNISGDLILPSNPRDGNKTYTLTKISDAAFSSLSLTSVSIPSTIDTIGYNAFNFCAELQKAEFTSLEHMCSMFFGSNPLTLAHNLYINGKEIKDLIIPNSVKYIGRYTFSGCNFNSVYIPASVEAIGEYAFSNCSGLTKVEFESIESLLRIDFQTGASNPLFYGHHLYVGGEEIFEVTIPDGITEIKNYTFGGCSFLTNIYIPESVNKLGDQTFSGCSLLKTVALPEAIDEIPYGLFSDCEGLTEMHIPSGVKKINSVAFRRCISLKDINIPSSVKEIGLGSFANCKSFKDLIIPESITVIGSSAFVGCDSLESIKSLAIKAPNMDESVFSDKVIKTVPLEIPTEDIISYLGSNWGLFVNIHAEQAKFRDYNDGVFNYRLVDNGEDRYAILMPGEYSDMTVASIPERITYVPDNGTPERYYVKAIGSNAFSMCSNLEEIHFSSRSQVEVIGGHAFGLCKALKEISIPSTVKSIGSDAFQLCSSLSKSEFASLEALLNIDFNAGSNPIEYSHNLYIDGKEITEVVVPSTITSIKNYAFFKLTSLKSVVIPSSVTSIGDFAFQDCANLTDVTIASSVSDIGIQAFYRCASISTINIPNAVKRIKSYTFCGCTNLKSVSISNSVVSIETSAFAACDSLERLRIPASVKYIDKWLVSGTNFKTLIFEDGTLPLNISYDALSYANKITELYLGRQLNGDFYVPKTLETLTLGSVVHEVKANMFKDYESLAKVTLGDGLNQIGDGAFSGCTKLTEIVVPPSVTSIGASAFSGCKLNEIVMGHNLKEIGEYAFDGCYANNVKITAQVPPLAPNNTFSYYAGKLWVQDPGDNSVINAYQDAYTCWDRFDSYAMINPSEIKFEGETTIEGKAGDKFQLSAQLMPENVTLPTLFWRSTNPDIATVDQTGLVTLHADMQDVRAMSVDNESYGNCIIIAESLYANGPTLQVRINNTGFDGVEEIVVDRPDTASEIDFSAKYDVYNINGVFMGNSTDNLTAGFYIIRQGSTTKKIVVR